MRPLFIVIEGIDGAGKSTQADYLRDYWQDQGQPAIISPEPTDGPIGQLIRQCLQSPGLPIAQINHREQQMAYLFASDRHYHLYNDQDGVYHQLANQCHVITPRYYFSSLAYNCHTDEEWAFVQSLNQHFPNPDFVIYLDLAVDLALERIRCRTHRECYEETEKLLAVSQNYQKIFADYPDPLLCIEGSQNPEKIHQEIIHFIHQFDQ
ncbi:MAG: dTMP kinase [Microcystaceae cyanobacterium]